jgi:hypothetical protein
MPAHRFYDAFHDDEERRQTAAPLAHLPNERSARVELEAGTGPIAPAHLVDGDAELVERLKQIWLEGYDRMLRRHGAGFRVD